MSNASPCGEVSPLSKLSLISNQLRQLADLVSGQQDQLNTGHTATLLEVVQSVLAERKALAKLLGDDVFTNGPLNMMLDLYENAWLQKPISVTSLTIASCVPPTTALRYIGYLESAQLLTKQNDGRDGRRVLVTLTPRGFEQVSNYLIQAAGLWGVHISGAPTPAALS